MDIVTRSILHHVNPDVFSVSSYSYIQASDQGKTIIDSAYYLVSAGLLPVAMGFMLPVFMHSAVLERESKIKGIMKSHGLKEIIYWMVVSTTGILLYLAVYGVFAISAQFIFAMPLFLHTNSWLLVGCTSPVYCKLFMGTQSNRPRNYPTNLFLQLKGSQHLRVRHIYSLPVHQPGGKPPIFPFASRDGLSASFDTTFGIHTILLLTIEEMHGQPMSSHYR